MSLNTSNITGRIALPDDTNPANAVVRFTHTGFDTEASSDTTVLTRPVEAAIDASGDIAIDLWRNANGERTTRYAVDVVIRNPDSVADIVPLSEITIPLTGDFDLNDLLPISPPSGATVEEYIASLSASAAEAQDSANVAAALAGTNRLAAADLYSDANVTLSGEQTIDGTLTASSRVLLGGQTDATENGVWVTASGAWTRATDADTSAEIARAFIYVTGGSVYASSSYAVDGTPTLGTDNITLLNVPITGSITAGQVGLGNADNTSDLDKPVSFDQSVALEAKANGRALTVPAASKENIITSKDGRVLMRRDGDTLFLGTSGFDIGGVFHPLSIKTDDGRSLFRVDAYGNVEFAGQKHTIDPFSQYRIRTKDGETLLSFDSHSGGIRAVLSPDRFELSGRASKVRGDLCSGQVTDVRGSGEMFAYCLKSRDFAGKVIGRDTGDWAAPHIADSLTFDVLEADGQSWQTIADYTPSEIDQEETSGATGLAISRLLTPMVSTFRDLADVGTILPDDDLSGQQDTISDGDVPGELHRFAPRTGFTISRMAAASRAVFQERLGLPANPTLVLNVGWPGTTSEKFLPENASYDYTDDSGSAQTTTAVEHPDAGAYLWANNLLMRDAVKGVVDDKWRARPLSYEFLTWIQGLSSDYGNATGFLGEYRAQQDALSIPGHTGTRHIMWDQNAGKTDLAIIQNGYQATVDFCQANASGKDWLVGPRYPHRMRDNIHHSSFGALEYAERTGQAMAYVQAYGTWAPLWITNVSFSGATVTLTTNRPAQAVGDLIADTDAITANTNHGFTLWDATADTEISISSVAISGTTITLTAGATLSGSVEVGYAARGATRTAGTVAAPEHSATWGNIKMKGRDAPAYIANHVQPTLDAWLCSHKKTYSV